MSTLPNWYLFSGGQVSGPYTEDHIRAWIRSGYVSPQDRLSRDGTTKWLTQDQIPEFEADFWAAPTPAPTPPPPVALSSPAVMPPPAAPPQYMPVQYQMPGPPQPPPMPMQPQAPYGQMYYRLKDKTTAGIFALLLGGVGAHHFYLGNTGIAIAYLFIWFMGAATLWIGIGYLFIGIPGMLALIEGIIYLTKPEDQFQRNYRNWFCSGP